VDYVSKSFNNHAIDSCHSKSDGNMENRKAQPKELIRIVKSERHE